MSDPRTRNTRHTLTPDNLSTSILVTNLPSGWNQDVMSSVIAGSGPVIQISNRTDPRTGKVNGLVYEYKEASDCKRAYELLQRVKKLPVELERIIPHNYKNRDVSDKPEITLERDHFPWSSQLELPFEMISEVPLPKKSTMTNSGQNGNNNNIGNSGNNGNGTSSNNVVIFPEILTKSSQRLPKLEPDALTAADKISQNLEKIPPPQLIEVITNLKMLANQGNTQRAQLETFLKSSNDIIISMAQAMLEMGFIDYDIVTQVMKDITTGDSGTGAVAGVAAVSGQTSSSNETSSHGTPIMGPYANATPTMPMVGMAPQPPAPMGMNMMPPMQFMPPQPQFGFPPQPVNPQGKINMIKLQQLPENQREMVRQVLKLTDDQITALPEQQKTMVTNLRNEYLY